MPSRLHQSSPHLTQAAGGAPLAGPISVGVFALTIADAVTGNVDWTGLKGLTFRILDFWAVKIAGGGNAGNALQLQTAGGAVISTDLDMNVLDQALVRTALIDDATHTIAAEGALRVRRTKAGGNAAAVCFVKIAIL